MEHMTHTGDLTIAAGDGKVVSKQLVLKLLYIWIWN